MGQLSGCHWRGAGGRWVGARWRGQVGGCHWRGPGGSQVGRKLWRRGLPTSPCRLPGSSFVCTLGCPSCTRGRCPQPTCVMSVPRQSFCFVLSPFPLHFHSTSGFPSRSPPRHGSCDRERRLDEVVAWTQGHDPALPTSRPTALAWTRSGVRAAGQESPSWSPGGTAEGHLCSTWEPSSTERPPKVLSGGAVGGCAFLGTQLL